MRLGVIAPAKPLACSFMLQIFAFENVVEQVIDRPDTQPYSGPRVERASANVVPRDTRGRGDGGVLLRDIATPPDDLAKENGLPCARRTGEEDILPSLHTIEHLLLCLRELN